MQGLAAITANNGWAMAVVGACIVMSGLAVLSFIISQLHKIVNLLVKKNKVIVVAPEPEPTEKAVAPSDILSDLEAAARIFKPMTSGLGENFTLLSLYQLLDAEKHPHPHITVRELRGAGYLVPAGKVLFRGVKFERNA